MPSHATSPRTSPPARRRRRTLTASCAVLAAALGLAACGTANGALRPQPGVTTASSPAGPTSSAPSAGPTGTPSSPGPSGSGPGTPMPPGAPATSAATATSPAPAAPKPTTPKPPATAPSTAKPPAHSPAPTAPPATRPPSATATPAPPPPPPPANDTATSVVRSTASGGRTVALTFDDGPGPATGQVLDLLAQYGAKATFCQIGQQAAANPALVKRIIAAGHRLCDHSVDHPQPFAALSHDRAGYEIAHAQEQIVRAGGPGTRVSWFRAPGGGFTADNQRIAAGLGLRPLGWSVDPRDWSRPGAASIVASVQSQLRPGGVVLLHDGGGDRSQTVAALKQLLPWLVAQGYRFDFPAG
ncbi:polysaccharide deacetylase family protein [Kitasatospora sp. CM 4170]|uniref:Polysaccharide deacetylase family protein n=1 Tax=Kitasatospora aburaviensis TaxID=67265 RepID=A0ABW1EPY8_9ACTN|nr:polysaccharide deacetylase family protein [Kitasatospora sp. CM 4170]WNM45226.1 polysaccharide deacetylase family protein [Kitasatospora sp. CM 4170]